jgi:hypothetical protein
VTPRPAQIERKIAKGRDVVWQNGKRESDHPAILSYTAIGPMLSTAVNKLSLDL